MAGDDEDEYVCCHTVSMRQALAYCREIADQCLLNGEDNRGMPLAAFCGKLTKRSAREGSEADSRCQSDFHTDIPVILCNTSADCANNDDDARNCFRLYLQSNRPCLVRGISTNFRPAHDAWIRQADNDNGTIRRCWFLETIGSDTYVPVKRLPRVKVTAVNRKLDEEGRAPECETIAMALCNYVSWMDKTLEESSEASLYLKDWHLQAWLEAHRPDILPLYTLPDIFPHDLLNSFLMRFTKGDYRFVYWGPAGSHTALHSDVLNSFSWSYNVHGTKEWTFHVPDGPHHNMNDEVPTTRDTIQVVHQEAGDLMFVPSGWKHSVVNLKETLSINHNWVTTNNLDRVWDCIATELRAVDTELESSWSIDCYEARESMLRGCIGLDVTAYFFMILCRGLELLQSSLGAATLQATVDLARIREALLVLFHDEKGSIHLADRLGAILADDLLRDEAISIATAFLSNEQDPEHITDD
jgi:JmjC domain, hydroxylase